MGSFFQEKRFFPIDPFSVSILPFACSFSRKWTSRRTVWARRNIMLLKKNTFRSFIHRFVRILTSKRVCFRREHIAQSFKKYQYRCRHQIFKSCDLTAWIVITAFISVLLFFGSFISKLEKVSMLFFHKIFPAKISKGE